jgi:enoyl-CoA hydratase/carnithine racemase
MSVIDCQTSAGIATVTLNRPGALNAFNNDVFDELCEVFMHLASDDNAKVLLLTGAGLVNEVLPALRAR